MTKKSSNRVFEVVNSVRTNETTTRRGIPSRPKGAIAIYGVAPELELQRTILDAVTPPPLVHDGPNDSTRVACSSERARNNEATARLKATGTLKEYVSDEKRDVKRIVLKLLLICTFQVRPRTATTAAPRTTQICF